MTKHHPEWRGEFTEETQLQALDEVLSTATAVRTWFKEQSLIHVASDVIELTRLIMERERDNKSGVWMLRNDQRHEEDAESRP